MDRRPEVSGLEEQLILDIALSVPVAIWAAAGPKHDFAIQLWSPGAALMYGISREEALGSNYLDLFVNEFERSQAIADHIKTATTQKPYRNLARDRIAGRDAVILTQGFALWHPQLQEYMQAEIAVDVTDVPGREADWLAKVRQLAFQERELKARTTLLEQLNDSSVAVGSMTDESKVHEVVGLIFSSARELLTDIRRMRIWFDGSDGQLVLLDCSDAKISSHQFEERELRDWIMRSGEEIRVDYKVAYPPTRPRDHRGTRSSVAFPSPQKKLRKVDQAPFLGLPLVAQGQTVGVCLAYFDKDFTFSNSESASALRYFVLQAANAIAEARRVRADREKNALIAEQQERVMRARISAEYTHAMAKRADALRWICELLREELPSLREDPAALEKYLSLIEGVSDAIASSAEALETAVKPSVFNVSDVIEGLTNRFSLQYPRLNVTRTLANSSALIKGVRVFVEGAVENLMFNAVDAVQAQGSLHVAVTRKARTRTARGTVSVTVCDNGVGLKVPFATLLEPGVSSKGAGHGFGLTRARQVAEECGGSLSVTSLAGWSGACIRMILPLADDHGLS